jgi:DNA transposition AAA+ family ATPase
MKVIELNASSSAAKDAIEPVKELPFDAPEPQCVETPTHKKIYHACAHAHRGDLVLVYGAGGVGKSTALMRYAEQHWERGRKAYYFNLHGVKTPASMLQTIAQALDAPGAFGPYRNVSLLRVLADSLSPKDVLLADECSSLRPDALDLARHFLDESGTGLVLAGNELVYEVISGKNRRAQFSQLDSRVGMKIHLPHSTEADANAVLSAWGVADREGRQYGRQIALGVGGLRRLCRVLGLARVSAIAKRRQIDYELMHATTRVLGLDD